jgi:RNA polymerase sigma-70 factor, ECF subfamily
MDPSPPQPSYSISDKELIAAMSGGDQQALGVFYDRWAARVNGLAIMLLKDPREAEEVTEDTFWQAWRQSPSFDASRGAAGSWLMMIARSRSLDRIRARKRRREESIDDVPSGNPAIVEQPVERDLDADSRGAVVRRALSGLPADQREAIELAYFGGLSQTEIADRKQLPLGTVKTRIRLGMARLRDALVPQSGEVAR